MKLKFRQILEIIENFLSVETKDSRVIPFLVNNIQSKLVSILDKFKQDNPKKPLRIIILKGRQFGISTLIAAIFFIKCLLVPNTRAAIIAHDQESTKKLFRRVRFFAKTMFIDPMLDKESEKEYSFPRTNSYFYIGTAGSKGFGRGDNLTDVHCSEVAFWPNASMIMNGLLNAVGKTGNVIIETTANGVGNYFYRLWKKSWKNDKSSWFSIFLKWTRFAEYEMEPEEGFRMTEEERHLCSLHKDLTPRKLAWRRWKISEIEAEPGQDPILLFNQEYPLKPREAFISSGKSVFSLRALEGYKTKEPVDVEDGWKIWKRPSGYAIMSIDSAEGLENNDRSVIDIYDENLEQVAQWAGWCDPDELAVKAVNMALRYNAFIINEVNNMGIAVNIYLRKHYPLHKQYYRERFDATTQKKVKKLGWRTGGGSSGTKSKAVADLAKEIREHTIIFNCAETVDECMSFIKNGNGGYEADEGANDDRVTTAWLAVQAYYDHPPVRKTMTPEEKKKDDIERANKLWQREQLKKKKKRFLNKRAIKLIS